MLNMKNNITTFSLLISAIIFLTSCEKHDMEIKAEIPKEIIKVEVSKPQDNPYTKPCSLSGVIKAHQKSVLSSKVTAQVIDITFNEGTQIKFGETLIKLDDREAKLKLAKSESDANILQATQQELVNKLEELKNKVQMLFHDQEKYISEQELAKTTFERYNKLFEKDVITKQELDEYKAKLNIANATISKSQAEYNLMIAKKRQLESTNRKILAQIERNKAEIAESIVNSSYYQITSPLNGFIVKKYVDVGDMATVGNPLISVENPNTLYLEIEVEESKAFIFKPGAKVEVRIDAYNNTIIIGTVKDIIPSADQNSHTFRVMIDLPPHKVIHSGMYARAVVHIGGKSIFIPRTAIITRGQITGVFVVDDTNTARFRIIKPGEDIQGFVEVLSGLTNKDKVIISKLDLIVDGTKVKI